jgi:N-acetylglucosamine-6-phosphate deacetylase
LSTFLSDVAAARAARPPGSARVLPAHLESNFINPGFRGAQPLEHLRVYHGSQVPQSSRGSAYGAADILAEIDRRRGDVGIVTLAPEIGDGLDLIRRFAAAGVRVSLGHSGASFEQAREAIAAGARHATHLFNRMSPMTHRDPGLAGAVLAFDDIAAELICDGHHVHPAVMQVAIAAKGVSRIMAITDGTAGAGLPPGSCVRLGGQEITVGDVARLADGTIAGSVLTMDRVFQTLVGACAGPIEHVAELCATTPARELGLHDQGVIGPGALADLVVLDSRLTVQSTWIAGAQVWGQVLN